MRRVPTDSFSPLGEEEADIVQMECESISSMFYSICVLANEIASDCEKIKKDAEMDPARPLPPEVEEFRARAHAVAIKIVPPSGTVCTIYDNLCGPNETV
jgi:hypothetical protein